MNAAVIPIYVAIIAGLFGLISFVITKWLERRSVSKALLAEIQRLLVVIHEHHGHWTKWMENKETQKHPLIPFSSDVYAKNIESLGLVNRKYVGLIVKFYGYLKFVNSLQKTQAKDIELHGGSSESFDHIYQASLARMIKDFENAFDKAFKHYRLT
jgi:hypothetical protein